ncbi:cdkn1a interacting zinc finger protein 1b isoform X2 [Acanthochromis polyacanthus]|uniref:cdkn1a interacting zinc finger protein 1b isoform X2 n=1 Tax=Acanthochromis polyacanthus TaxID=80966 RepID=UPI0022344790|nr:cdkn1a interacting zinc finger protein 1b isoform X2 [Acanthochromis polyacanthus]
MVKQPRRTDSCSVVLQVLSTCGRKWRVEGSVPCQTASTSAGTENKPALLLLSWIHLTDVSVVVQVTGSSAATTEEETPGGPGSDGASVEAKRARPDGGEEAAALTNQEKASGSCGPAADVPPPDQQVAAELQSVGSLKVTIQQSSESREFGQTDRTADRQTGGLHCHVCNLTCHSLQVFQDHMSGAEHQKKLQQITQSIRLNTHTLQDRGRRPEAQRWCDSCQAHFTGDVIVHRRTKQHKMCKQLCRPFCPVCKRHFRTPRKFVEHMKSPEHKQQVTLEAQEEELITVDAVGCFQEEEEEEEEEVDVAEEEEGGVKELELETAGPNHSTRGQYDPHTIYGSSFVVPVCGFVCRLCNKFFYTETAAKHTHCRTHTHYLKLQRRGEVHDDLS